MSLLISPPSGLPGNSLGEFKLPSSIPEKSEYHTLKYMEVHALEYGFTKFVVMAPHANYEVVGLLQLKKLIHEIQVIEKMKYENAGSGIMDGAKDSVVQTGKGFAALVTSPVDSAKGVGRAAGKIGSKVGSVFRHKEEGEQTSFSEKMLGATEREIANELGVDVYSDNPYLRHMLKQLAQARLGGKGIAMIGKILLPVAGLVSVAVTASGVNAAADQFVNNSNRLDLFQGNKKALLAMGYDETVIKDFLNQEFYSPREITYLRFYLEKLKQVPGHEGILQAAASAKSLWTARKILYECQMAVDVLETFSPPPVYLSLDDAGLYLEGKNRAVFLTPYDYLDHSPAGEKVIQRLTELRKKRGKIPLEVRNAGQISKGFVFAANGLGINTKEWVLLAESSLKEPI